MAAASRVLLVPPEAWDEERLAAAARNVVVQDAPVRPGDELAGLVVVGVEPAPGASLADSTEIEIRPLPRVRSAPVVDLVVLIDRSGSMAEVWDADHTRAEAAEKSLRAFLRAPGASIGALTVMAYAKQASTVAGPAPAKSIQLDGLDAPRGRAATARAVDATLAHLAANPDPARCQAILMLTDGVGEVDALRLAGERAARLHVPIHAIVFAPEEDEVFHELAKRTGGSVQRAMLPLEIDFVHEAAA